MRNHLYFICPSDALEQVINNTSKGQNYYYTSLGNSVEFNSDTIDEIERLIRTKNIKEISFILSIDNQIINDALGHQSYANVRGLKNFYNTIINQKRQSQPFWHSKDQFSILSYHLNNRIKDLQIKLSNLPFNPIAISGKIYDRQSDTFKTIYSDLICFEKYILN